MQIVIGEWDLAGRRCQFPAGSCGLGCRIYIGASYSVEMRGPFKGT